MSLRSWQSLSSIMSSVRNPVHLNWQHQHRGFGLSSSIPALRPVSRIQDALISVSGFSLTDLARHEYQIKKLSKSSSNTPSGANLGAADTIEVLLKPGYTILRHKDVNRCGHSEKKVSFGNQLLEMKRISFCRRLEAHALTAKVLEPVVEQPQQLDAGCNLSSIRSSS